MMKGADEVLRKWSTVAQCRFGHHLYRYLTCFHIIKLLQIRFSTHFAEEQQQFRLTVCECITLYVIGVIVVFHTELHAQFVLLTLAQWL